MERFVLFQTVLYSEVPLKATKSLYFCNALHLTIQIIKSMKPVLRDHPTPLFNTWLCPNSACTIDFDLYKETTFLWLLKTGCTVSVCLISAQNNSLIMKQDIFQPFSPHIWSHYYLMTLNTS